MSYFATRKSSKSKQDVDLSDSSIKTRRTIIGRHGEELAEAYLKDRGFKVIERNFRCFSGEIDLIVLKKETLHFVEVRTRQNSRFGSAAASITRQKQLKLSKAAYYYLQHHGQWGRNPKFFSVVTVEFYEKEPIIQFIPNAFEVQGGY